MGSRTNRRLLIFAIVVPALVLAACTSPSAREDTPVAAKSTTTTTAPQPVLPVGYETWSATVLRGSVSVHTDPNDAAPVIKTFERTNRFGFDPTVFGVLGETRDAAGDAWLHVQVPETEPNGTQGWVRPSNTLAIRGHNERIVIDLAAHTVTFSTAGQPVAQWSAGIGKAGTPTPRGSFYVWTKFLPEHGAAAAYGPGVLGLNAMSETIDTWQGSDPLIGIHGTRRASDLGSDVSNGCVRIEYDATTFLLTEADLGIPVDIV